MSIVRVPFSLTGGGAAAAYVPAGAIWFDGAADYLTRTPSSTGSPKTQTFSVWVKKGTYIASSTNNTLFGSFADASNYSYIGLDGGGNGKQRHNIQIGGANVGDVVKTGLDRDLTAWFHLVVVFDITNITSGDRIRVYQNGVRQTAFSTETYPSTTDTPQWSTSGTQEIISSLNGYHYFNGYMAEFIRLDGYAGTADDFGEFDTNGNWVPIDPTSVVTANKGTNGFWLDFADSADLGNDVSGNGNDWTPTSMSAANSTSDRPADDADNDVGNYATINLLGNSSGGIGSAILSRGNLRVTNENGVTTHSCIEVSSGKWYFEAFIENIGANPPYNRIHVTKHNNLAQYMYRQNGDKETGGSPSSYGNSWTTNDYIGCAVDMDAGKIWFSKNGVWQNSGDPVAGTGEAFSGISGLVYFGCIVVTNSITVLNFGQTAYQYSAPTGFKNLYTANLSAPTVTDPSVYFNTVLYTGNGSTQAITGVGFQPDLVWLKSRDTAYNHQLMDAVRGVSGVIASNLPDAESTSETDSFDSDGFTLTHNPAIGRANVNTKTFVAWCLKAGGAGSSNTDGSITSTVSAAAHGGFSIGTYTGTGANATIGHGLSSAPGFIMIKKRSTSPDQSWANYHDAIGATKWISLNNTWAATPDSTIFNDTDPTSSVFSVGTGNNTNNSGGTYVFYAFARVPGLIGIGSYVGNGSADGPYVVVDDGASGFRPAFVMWKDTTSTWNWWINDSTRSTYNPVSGNELQPNLTNTEGGGMTMDYTANGFKVRNSSLNINKSGDTFIYLAFAEHPFGGEDVAQARAR
jgi:hypothetical protein